MQSFEKESEYILSQYILAVKEIKHAIIDSRYRSVRQANKEILSLYYWVGNYVSVNSRTGKWNTNAISVISRLLQQELPGLTGFSETNIKNMRIFYEAWSPFINYNSTQYNLNENIEIKHLLNRQMTTADLSASDWDCFLSIGFSNHREIIRRTSTLEERLFYIRRCAKEIWKVETTKYHLNEDLYHKEGSIQQTNFDKTIEESDFKQNALQTFKDEYKLDFINIDNNEDLNEKIIERHVLQNIKNFIMA